MAILNAGTLMPYGAPVLQRKIVANSVTMTASDSVKVDTSGFIALGTAGAPVYGHAGSMGTDKGVGLSSTGAAGADFGTFVGTFTFASDNETVAKNRAEVDISKFTLYSAEVDVAIGTTTGSDLLGYHMDLIDEDTLDESTAATTTAQYFTHGLDPLDSTRAIVNVFESSVFGPI